MSSNNGHSSVRPCTLDDADLSEATLVRANLCGVDLRFVKGLTREQLEQAVIDEHTQLPDYLRKPR